MTTTRMIADTFNKRHAQVMDIVRERIEDGTFEPSWVEESTYTPNRGGEQIVLVLNTRATLEIIGGYTGAKARKLRKEFLDNIM